MKRRIILLSVFTLISVVTAFAGGPLYVAGVSGFNPSATGQPITWANGTVNYYTDQGDLSPLLPGTAADTFVADAFAPWSSVATAAVQINHAGQLSENVSGSNVQNAGSLILPTDIQPNSPKPVAIIYDYDGSVIDAFLGAGAGSIDMCNANSVITLADSFTADGHFAHALVLLNGNCAQYSSDLPLLKYRLARQLGHLLGLDWSQLNENVSTGSPPPTMDDYNGYPLMHPIGSLCFVGGSCLANPLQPRMDDRAALSRLYPVTSANIGNFSGKTLFRENTARIRGNVRFPDWNAAMGQGMQGVNVVARMIDPATRVASHKYTASCVSGFLFRGYAGNPITGYTNNNGEPFDHLGSNDISYEGFFDLAGLEFPPGYNTVQYQLSLESMNSLYIEGLSVGPYKNDVIPMSGSFTPVTITVSKGDDVSKDLTVLTTTSQPQDQWEPSSFAQPAAIPSGGDWIASLSAYGDTDYYTLHARAGRTLTFSATALNENGSPTISKAQPAIALWQAGDGETTPTIAQPAFQNNYTGSTRLSAEVGAEGDYKLGVADMRGDGRPDFRYEARLLYGDTISPARASVHNSTRITITGFGFTPTTTAKVGTSTASILSQQAGQLVISAPPLSDSVQTIYLSDAATGMTAEMDDVLSYGAINTKLWLALGANPPVTVGTQAPNPVRVRVTENDGTTPVYDAPILFSAPSGVVFPACGTSSCTLFTDESGQADAYMVVTAAGDFTITASTSTGASVHASVTGVTSTLDITLAQPTTWVASGATTSIPMSAVVVGNGQPLSGRTVNFQVLSGSATLTASSAITNSNGTATTQVKLNNLASDVIVSACAAPANSPCRNFTIRAVDSATFRVSKVSGDNQTITVGQNFSSIKLRVTDSSATPNAVTAASVQFVVTAMSMPDTSPTRWNGEAGTTTPRTPVVLSSSSALLTTDTSGNVTLPVSLSSAWGPLLVTIQATAGNTTQAFTLRSSW